MSKRGRDDGSDDDSQRSEKIPKLEGINTVKELLHQLASYSENESESAEDAVGPDASGDDSDGDNRDSDASDDDSSVERFLAAIIADPDADGQADNDSNAPSWATLSEITDSGSGQPEERTEEQETVDDDGEGTSPLRVPQKKEEGGGTAELEPEPEPEPEPDSSSSNRPAKTPKVSDMKINAKDHAQKKRIENNPERSTPRPQYSHSDEDSEDEGKPKREYSEEFEGRVIHRRPAVKKPPEKDQ